MCPGGYVQCGAASDPTCVPSNNSNCGICGNQCAAGTNCNGHDCLTTCSPPPLQLCNNACVNVSNDSSNCGRCGNPCPTNFRCVQGACSAACTPMGMGCSSLACCSGLTCQTVFDPMCHPTGSACMPSGMTNACGGGSGPDAGEQSSDADSLTCVGALHGPCDTCMAGDSCEDHLTCNPCPSSGRCPPSTEDPTIGCPTDGGAGG